VRVSSGVFVLLLWATVGASAQTTVTTQPAAPTHSTPVTVVLFNSCGCPAYLPEIFRDGFTFDVPHTDGCLTACLATTRTYDVGPLPAGTYTVRQFLDGYPATAEVIGTFVVGPAQVPALGAGGLVLLALLLTASALLALRRLAG
jgi:hypothetical protein